MNTSLARRHVVEWLAALLAVPLLYVATWPPIDIKNTTFINATYSSTTPGTIISRPPWITTLYQPLHDLSDLNGRRNPLARYWDWWLERLL